MKFIATSIVAALMSTSVMAQQRPIVRLANEVASLVQSEIDYLSQEERRQVRRNLREAKRLLTGGGNIPPGPGPGPGPNPPYPPTPPQPTGHYCVAACSTVSGGPSMKYSAGATGQFEIQAKQNAVEAVKNKYSCNYGIVEVACDQSSPWETFSSIAACTNVSGEPNLLYSALGSGPSRLQAQQDAREKLTENTSCNYGVKISETSEPGSQPAYCIAACSTVSGTPSSNYSKGASGNNLTEARYNAVQSVKDSYSCNYGIVVSECSTNNF